jgi:hypothetical protein
MSLKAVHLFFVSVLSGLAFLCAAWKLRDYSTPQGTMGDLFFGLGAIFAAVVVIIYGRHFLKKLKNISYL